MTDAKPAAAAIAAPSHLPYATFPPRAHRWRVAAGIAALVLGCGGILAGFVTVWHTLPWTMRSDRGQITLALAAYSIEFLARLATALFGLALLSRSPRAWHAVVAYF